MTTVAELKARKSQRAIAVKRQSFPSVENTTVGKELKKIIRSKGASCTQCFNQTLTEMDTHTIAEVRANSYEYAKAVGENALEGARLGKNARHLVTWAATGGDSLKKYESLVLDACDRAEQSLGVKNPHAHADIVLDTALHGFGDAALFFWATEGLRQQGKTIAHYAPPGPMADLCRCFGQMIVQKPVPNMLNVNVAYNQEKEAAGKLSALHNRCKLLGVKPIRPKLLTIPDNVNRWAIKIIGQRPVVLLFPQATRPLRVWPMRYWMELKSLLNARGLGVKVIVWGEEGTRWSPYVSDVVIDPKWIHVIALMKRSRAVIGNNSGPVWVAGTLDVTAFVLSGLNTKEELGGIDSMHYVGVCKEDCSCVGCYYQQPPRTSICNELGCLALQSLTPMKVIEHYDLWSSIPRDRDTTRRD